MSDSTILVKSPDGWKVKATLGLGFLILIVILAFMYHIQVGAGVLVVSLGIGARVCVWAWHQYNLANHQKNLAILERRFKLAEVTIKEYEAARARLMCHFLEFNTGVFRIKHPDEMIEVEFYPAVQASKWLADAPQLALPEPEPPAKRLLDINFIHMLIRGPSGSGKTTIGNWLIDNARPGAAVYVLDPHASQNASKGLPWSARAEVVGDGRDWGAIDIQLQMLIEELDRRYKPGAVFQEVLIVSDEWLAVLENCPHAERFFKTIGSEARKVDMRLVIMTISATVDDLKCPAAVRDNLLELRLDHSLKSRNRGEIRWGRGSVELVELPGAYRAFLPARAVTEPVLSHVEGPMPVQEVAEPVPDLDAGPVPPLPDPTDLRIFQLHQQGKRPYAIWKEVYPGKSYGGEQAAEIKAVLAKFGVLL